MVASLDASIGFGTESTYKTGVVPTRWVEFTDETLDWKKNIKQGQGLRVGSRVARSGRRVVPTAQGGGDVKLDAVSRGLGLLWSYLMGSGTSTLVSGSTYQQVFTFADSMPSFTTQKGVPRLNGDGTFTVDPYTFRGCTCDSFEIELANADICTVKATIDAADMDTATAYTAPSYSTAPNVFHFAGGAIYSGTLTAPTATTLATGATPLADVRGGTISVNHNAKQDRFNFGGGGRKAKPTTGLRKISGKLDVEYDTTSFRDAVINETPMVLVANYTGGALTAGTEMLQVVVSEIKFDDEAVPKVKSDGDLVMQSLTFEGLDNLTAAQAMWIVTRTADTAL